MALEPGRRRYSGQVTIASLKCSSNSENSKFYKETGQRFLKQSMHSFKFRYATKNWKVPMSFPQQNLNFH
jgi:hypothetical protein